MSEGNVAVDVGFGQTKWAVKLDGVIITGGFPSLAPISSGVTVSTNESMGGKRNTVKVVVGNTSFEIGPDSHLAKSEASTGRSLSEEFPTTNNYKALLLGALHYSGATHGLCRNKVERTKNVARVRKIKKLNYKTVQLWTKADLWRQVSFAFSESYAWFQYPQ